MNSEALSKLFIAVLNMSIVASFIVIAVMLIRLPLSRVPKFFSYILWSAVWIRLVYPVAITSSISMLGLFFTGETNRNGTVNPVPADIGLMKQPAITMGSRAISETINDLLPRAAVTASINPMQLLIFALSIVWAAGAAMIAGYAVISYWRLKRSVSTATLVDGNVYESDRISSPFVYGLIKPKVYLPLHLQAHERPYIIEHEQVHIRRFDYLIKPAAFLILCLHWFNPFMWLAYKLMCKDMEMSCDESVLRKMGSGVKASYSTSLLSLSTNGSVLSPTSPLGFGESQIKARIKNIMRFKQPSRWLVAVAAVSMPLLIVACTTNPPVPQSFLNAPTTPDAGPGTQAISLVSDGSQYNIKALLANKTPYVGNSSKVGSLIGALAFPDNTERNGMELHTTAQPYGLTMKLSTVNGVNPANEITSYSDVFYHNALILFALIDNVDEIHTQFSYQIDGQVAGSYQFTFTREQAVDVLGADPGGLVEDEQSLREFVERVASLTEN
ncbi:DUF4825 domain-containing protein [Paenibacillaceae bacterium]|nr:DUF4825 domain-containing protein [Paenibacillaceae bacterium]